MDRDVSKIGEPTENGLNDSSSSDLLPLDFGEKQEGYDRTDPSLFPKIEGYTILGLLGQGGMGAVYRAVRNKDSTRTIAVKTIRTNLNHLISEEEARRFLREIKILSSCSHPNVVKLIDHGTYRSGLQELPFYAMELLPQGNLGQWLIDNSVDSKTALSSIIARLEYAIRGLEELHKLDFVHRDLKPSNLLIDEEGAIKIGDFGLAKHLDGQEELTKTIGNLGTTPYSAPEQIVSAKSATHLADIYSVGVVLYQILSNNVRPFQTGGKSTDADSENEQIAMRQRMPEMQLIAPSRRENSMSDSSLDYICLKCLEYFPKHRYQSAGELADELRDWQLGKKLQKTIGDRLRTQIRRPFLRHWKIISIGLMASILIVSSIIGTYVIRINNGYYQLAKEQRESDLAELTELVPFLPSGTKYYQTRRNLNYLETNSKNLARANELVEILDLNDSQNLDAIHLHWHVMYSSRKKSSLQKDMRDSTRIAQRGIELALKENDVENLDLLIFDALRSLERLADSLTIPRDEQKLRAVIDEIDELGKFVAERPKTRKYQQLLLQFFRFRLKFYSFSTAEEKFVLCSESESKFALDTLNTSDYRPSFYLCWFFYQDFFDSSKDSKQPISTQIKIAEKFRELHVATPYENKEHNIDFLSDEIGILNRLSKLHRKSGDLQKAKGYSEEALRLSREAVGAYPQSVEIWNATSVAFSEMKSLVRDRREPNSELSKAYTTYIDVCKRKLEAINSRALEQAFGDERLKTFFFVGFNYFEWVYYLWTRDSGDEIDIEDLLKKLELSEKYLLDALKINPNHENANVFLQKTYELWIEILESRDRQTEINRIQERMKKNQAE